MRIKMTIRRFGALICMALALSMLSGCMTGKPNYGRRAPPGDQSRGWYFEVNYGDTLARISNMTGTAVDLIMRENRLGNPATLYEGLLLWIPPKDLPGSLSDTRYYSGQSIKTQPEAPRPVRVDQPRVASRYVNRTPKRAADADRLKFQWPVKPDLCRVEMTRSGVDLVADRGTPVFASQAGNVISSGPLRGYGNTIFIDHGNDCVTVYSHCDDIRARVGQRVRAGQTIGTVGASDAEKPKLHFELRKGFDAQSVNPMAYLPRAR